MCGRYVRKSPSAVYAEMFGVDTVPGTASYNVAPMKASENRGGHHQRPGLAWSYPKVTAKDASAGSARAAERPRNR